jgi:hypothetical protein
MGLRTINSSVIVVDLGQVVLELGAIVAVPPVQRTRRVGEIDKFWAMPLRFAKRLMQ